MSACSTGSVGLRLAVRVLTLALPAVLFVTGCSRYPASLEEKPVYSFSAGHTVDPIESGAFRLCAYNIENFTDAVNDGPERLPQDVEKQAQGAARLLNRIDPDILFLSEIENDVVVHFLNDKMAKRYPHVAVTQHKNRHGVSKLNLALLSRVEPLWIKELDFGRSSDSLLPPRGALCLAVELGVDHALLAYGVHLKSNYGESDVNETKRFRAMRMIRDHAEMVMATEPEWTWEVMILGDMNVDPDQQQFIGDLSLEPVADWHDLWRGRPLAERTTIPTRFGNPDRLFPPACFDRIIVSPALDVAPWWAGRAEVLQEGVATEDVSLLPGRHHGHVSDHYPVYVTLQR